MLVVPVRFKVEASHTGALLDALADGVWFTRIETWSVEAAHGALVMFHWKVYVPAVVMPVTVVVGEPELVMLGVTGPFTKVHESVPTLAALPDSVADPGLVQIVWSDPAFAVVGVAFTMMATSLVEAAHGLLLIVQRSVYVPDPPAWVKVAVGEVVLLNWASEVEGLPASMLQAPVPTPGALAANVTEGVVTQMVWSGPAFEVVGEAVTLITISSCVDAQGARLVVQRRV
jgi:hypothetical protein